MVDAFVNYVINGIFNLRNGTKQLEAGLSDD